MAMNLHDYFRIRCSNTLSAERNIELLFANMAKSAKDPTLKDMLHRHHDAIQCQVGNLEQMVTRLSGGEPRPGGGEKKTRKHPASTESTTSTGGEGEMVVVGRGWIGTIGAEVVEVHRTFIAAVPHHIVDVNMAMIAEEITHFNIGDYTGLIVLAKQLGEQEIAGMLQQNIDIETQMRTALESGGLAHILAEETQHERKAA